MISLKAINKYYAQVTILQEYCQSTTAKTMENNKIIENQVSFEIEMTSTALDKLVESSKIS